MSFKLDTSRFKKVKADKDSTTLQHESGHTLTIQHKPLSPKMRAQLSAIPLKASADTQDHSGIPGKNLLSAASGRRNEILPNNDIKRKMYDEGTPEQTVSKQDNAPVEATPSPSTVPSPAQSAAGQPSQSPVTINIGQPQPQAVPVPVPNPMGSSQASPQGAPQDVSSPMGDPRGAPQQEMPAAAPAPQGQAPAPNAPPAPMGGGQPPVQNQVPYDPYGVNATQQAFQQGSQQVENAPILNASGQIQQGQEQASARERADENLKKIASDFADNQRTDLQHSADALKAYQDKVIKPDHVFEHMSVPGKISTAIGLILGGISAGALHTSNPALDFLQKQIDRDVEAQKANLQKKATAYSGFLQLYGNHRDAADMATILQRNITENEMEKAKANAATPAALGAMEAALGKWKTDTAQMQGQMASRRTLLGGASQGLIPPEMLIRTGVIREADAKDFEKQLGEAKNAVSLRDMTLSAFDQANKINTAGNRMLSPRQTQYQIDSLLGPVVDTLTKDTSGRVTPETVKLIGAAFHTNWASPESVAKGRQSIVKLLSKNMHYSMLDAYQQDVGKWGQYDMNGNPRIVKRPPVTGK